MMKNDQRRKTYSAPSVKKAFRILQAIADSSAGLGISELAKELRIGKSTVHGITGALEEMGVIVRDPSQKRYRVGYTLLELGRRAYGKMDLKEVARKPMERLAREVGETAFLGVLNGDHVTILEVVESPNEMKITAPPGTRLPLLVGATGRVLLAQLEKEKAREIVKQQGLVRYTPKSKIDPEEFLRGVARAKKMGYAIDDEEYLLGARAIAAPIEGASLPPAALWIVGFSSSLDDRKMGNASREVQRTAMEISESLKAVVQGEPST